MQNRGLSELLPGRVDTSPVLVRPLHLAGALALQPNASLAGPLSRKASSIRMPWDYSPAPSLSLRPRAANVIKRGAMSQDVISTMLNSWQLECFCISIQLDISGYFLSDGWQLGRFLLTVQLRESAYLRSLSLAY